MLLCRARRLTAGARAAQGSECFAFFLQSGLGKGVLKDVWAAVAGDEGRLSQPQFVACLYPPPPPARAGGGPQLPPLGRGPAPQQWRHGPWRPAAGAPTGSTEWPGP